MNQRTSCTQDDIDYKKIIEELQGKLETERKTRLELEEKLRITNDRAEIKFQEQEKILHQFQKLEALGKLAGGIAHDFNNFLTVIIGYANIALENISLTNPLYSDIEQISKVAMRASNLTKQLLTFSRQQTMQPKHLNLNEIITDLKPMLIRAAGDKINLVLDLTPDLGEVIADPSQLDQVLINLTLNARDAIAGEGKIIIETTNVELDQNWHDGLPEGSYIMLSLTDTGCGMDKETISRIFEPFFTTKAPGKGTGFGLATVYGIIKQSKGGIWVYSEPGIGTTFKIYLPRIIDFSDIPEVKLPKERGNETVLLVEDDEIIRALVRSVLEQSGYTVLEVADSHKAFEVYEKFKRKIDVIITDLVMPNLSGFRVAELLQILDPAVKVLYMSGYSEKVLTYQNIKVAKDNFLQKPFTINALTTKLRQLLDNPSNH
jgi:two-component system, cell cycle sensor histidine kinase and response regulator CckA